MNASLSKNVFFVKEHPRIFKATAKYDVLDPESGEVLMECREENLGFLTKFFRYTGYKQMTPFNVVVRDKSGKQVVRVQRPTTFFTSKVRVFDENDQQIGGFRQKFFSFGGAFNVEDTQGNHLFKLKGKWTGWEFKFLAGEKELAHVTKKWAGIGKEFFSTADNYVLKISEDVPADAAARKLIVASVMTIDKVLRSR